MTAQSLPSGTPEATPEATTTGITALGSIGTWGVLAALLAATSLGLPWGVSGLPGYMQDARVPVAATILLAILGGVRRSRRLLVGAVVAAVVGVGLSGVSSGGPVVLLFAIAALVPAIARVPSAGAADVADTTSPPDGD